MHEPDQDTESVESNPVGNARLTGMLGALIFALLFLEGFTILRVQRLIVWHVFIGTLLVVFVGAKIATTTYRFARYYTGEKEYVEKGPPPIVLRVLGPVVTVTTVAVLATGVALVLDRGSHILGIAHKGSFILWFAAMTLHVLGHALETPALARADWTRSPRDRLRGASARRVTIGVVVLASLPLAVVSLEWAHHWRRLHGG